MPQLVDTFGIPNAIFAFIFIVIAIAAFAVALIFEKKNSNTEVCQTSKKYLIALAVIAFVIGASQLFVPSHAEHMQRIDSLTDFSSYSFNEITPDELAIRIIQKDKTLKFIDVRPEEEFKEFALPNAINGNYENFIHRSWEKVFRVKGQLTIIYANDEDTEKKAVLAANDVGFENVFILKGGLNQFKKDILDFQMPVSQVDPKMHDTYRFREAASKKLPKIIADAKPKVIEKKEVKRVLGGC